MSLLLDQAVAEVRKLPDIAQDAIAAVILEEIADDQRWEESFARSPGKLVAMVSRAEDQVRAGHCQTVGFDQL